MATSETEREGLSSPPAGSGSLNAQDTQRAVSGEPGAAAAATLPIGSLGEKLSFINAHKLAGNRPVYVAGGEAGGTGVRPATASSSTSSSAGQARWVQPSGPRRPGEGTENEEQGIISAEPSPAGGVTLRITLLASGFIIGPAGSTVREIMRVTGCDIKSWTDGQGRNRGVRRVCRVFVLDGEEESVSQAMDIITAAVDRYKELCEGRCQGQSVPRQQRVMGVDFSYQPPPRSVVPFAAALKGNITRPANRTPELNGAGAAAGGRPGMMPMLPGYLMPMTGPFMPPGSSGGPLPFPMYMPQLGLNPYESELGSPSDTGDVFSGAGGGNASLEGSMAGSRAAASGMPGAGPGNWGLPQLPNPYAYPGGMDPTSMMAYMSLLAMPPSPARFPGGPLDPAAGFGAGMAMPGYGMGIPPGSPMSAIPTGLPGYGSTAPGSPPGQFYGAAGGGSTSDPGAFGGRKSGFELPTSPEMTMHAPPAGMAPPGMPAYGPFGVWYPPSPVAMPLSMPGIAQGPGLHVHGGLPQPPHHKKASGSPSYHTSSSRQHSGSGEVASPSRLNPMAQPWGSGPQHAHHAAGAEAGIRHDSSVATTTTTNGPQGSSPTANGNTPAGKPHGAGPDVVSAATHAATSAVAAAMSHANRAGPQNGSIAPQEHDPHGLKLGGDLQVTLPGTSMMAMGKTPRRPTSINSGPRYPGGTASSHDNRSSIGSQGGVPLDLSPATIMEHTPGGHALGAPGVPGSHMVVRTSSSGNFAQPLGSGSTGPTSPAMVSSDDPLISPSRFSRGSRMRRPRSQQGLSSEGYFTSPTEHQANEPLQKLPNLLEQLQLSPEGPAQVTDTAKNVFA